MSHSDKVAYAKKYLRRTYDLDGLKALAKEVWETATDSVTLTSNSFEGGSASGEVTFEKAIIGLVVEELIEELDPDNAPFEGRMVHQDLGCRRIET